MEQQQRDRLALADAYEKHLLEQSAGKGNLICSDEDEATLLAKEMRKRGWRAKESKALQGLTELKVVDYVCVKGRRAVTRRLAVKAGLMDERGSVTNSGTTASKQRSGA